MRFRGKIRCVPGALVSVLAVCVVLLATAFSTPPASVPADSADLESCSVSAVPPPPGTELQPGVQELIANTYLAHAADFPDPNETAEVLRLYLEGNLLLERDQVDRGLDVFFRAVQLQPDSRHARAGLGTALWLRYQSTQSEDDLRSAAQELMQAAKIGISYGRVRYTDTIARALAEMQDAAVMDDFFQQALRVSGGTYLTHLHYAQGLSMLGDLRAEEWYKKAIRLQPDDNADALAYYAEWLLDQHREEDVLQIVRPDEHIEYLHFLRGVALERMGRVDSAREEYDKYAVFSRDFPAPARFRIEGSEVQRGVAFEGERRRRSPGESSVLLITSGQAREGLSYLLNKESPEETQGGMRMVGWTVRTRVFKGELQ